MIDTRIAKLLEVAPGGETDDWGEEISTDHNLYQVHDCDDNDDDDCDDDDDDDTNPTPGVQTTHGGEANLCTTVWPQLLGQIKVNHCALSSLSTSLNVFTTRLHIGWGRPEQGAMITIGPRL